MIRQHLLHQNYLFPDSESILYILNTIIINTQHREHCGYIDNINVLVILPLSAQLIQSFYLFFLTFFFCPFGVYSLDSINRAPLMSSFHQSLANGRNQEHNTSQRKGEKKIKFPFNCLPASQGSARVAASFQGKFWLTLVLRRQQGTFFLDLV